MSFKLPKTQVSWPRLENQATNSALHVASFSRAHKGVTAMRPLDALRVRPVQIWCAACSTVPMPLYVEDIVRVRLSRNSTSPNRACAWRTAEVFHAKAYNQIKHTARATMCRCHRATHILCLYVQIIVVMKACAMKACAVQNVILMSGAPRVHSQRLVRQLAAQNQTSVV